MTLEEAIEHCNEIIESESAHGCLACAMDHAQLKEWLLELKKYRETDKNNENATSKM